MINLSTPENLRKLRWVLAAMSRDVTKTHINQLYIGSKLIATDGYRVHRVELGTGLWPSDGFTVPPEVAEALPTLAKGGLWIDERSICSSEDGQWRITIGFSRAAFPDVSHYFGPIETPGVRVPMSKLRNAVKDMRGDMLAILDVVPGFLRLRCTTYNNKTVDRRIPIETPGGFQGPAGFNRKYLLDALRYLKGDVTLHLGKTSLDPLRLIWIDDNEDQLDAVVMPTRLTDKELGK